MAPQVERGGNGVQNRCEHDADSRQGVDIQLGGLSESCYEMSYRVSDKIRSLPII